MAGAELLLFGGDGDPGFDGAGLLDGVTFLAAIVFAIGEGVVFGRDALGEFEVAIAVHRGIDFAFEFAEEFGVARGHVRSGLAAMDTNHDFLDKGGAVEALAGFFPLLAVVLFESGGGAGDG